MPYSGFEADYYKERRKFYETDRAPTNVVINTSNASKTHDKFCPFDGRQLIFDRMSKNQFCCPNPRCGYILKPEEIGVKIENSGLTTIDGRTLNNPLYGTNTDGSGMTMQTSGTSRSKDNNKKLPLTKDDQLLVKQGLTIVQTTEESLPQPKLLHSRSSHPNPQTYSIIDKYKKKGGVVIHGL